ncbi:MAG: sigma 54-interacting transcriptional regulator [Nitrospirales bacterium]|nr:sigma 54-interacting transcriptional regulator [Nitrospirales bacterium]
MMNKNSLSSNVRSDLVSQVLLEITEAISKNRDLSALLRDFGGLLPRLLPVDFLALALYDPDRQIVCDYLIQANVPADIEGGKEWGVDDHPSGTAVQTQRPLLVEDLMSDHRYEAAFSCMREDGVRSLCAIPLTTAVRTLGAMVFASCAPATYQASDVQFLEHMAKPIAVAVDNVLHVQALSRERDHSRLLLEVNNAVVSARNLEELFAAMSASLRKVIPHVVASLYLYDPKTETFLRPVLDFPDSRGHIRSGATIGIDEALPGRAFRSRQPYAWDEEEMRTYSSEAVRQLLDEGMKSGASAPLVVRGQVLGTLNVASSEDHAFGREELELLGQVATQVAIGLDNAMAYQKITELKERLEQENVYLKDEIRTEHHFEEIIGDSHALKRVLQQVEIVAPTDSTVLIQGETGTGKELVARALHELSSRAARPFVKLNCAAIPTGLLESELFGHEKGAFTGAITQKVGRFELAHGGTIFLDEVGEISLELQSKLLRVLQEKEFERLGSTRTIRVDVRLVAATNRDLEEMVEANQFRNDLYYRLNVFPVTVPSLRDRPEDIPVLVRYFTQRYATRMKKSIESIAQHTMDRLVHYHWPGNVRELENLIERAVILSQGPELVVSVGGLKPTRQKTSPPITSLKVAERDHIVKALRESKWVIGGPRGAAARLGMKRTTLTSKMKKLGVSRPV